MDIIPILQPGARVVICALDAAAWQDAVRKQAVALAAGLALRGPLTVLDGGNCFQAYRVARLLRRGTVDVHAAARRLSIRRAFTCYQMLALLEDAPALRQPHLILDLLATFYDDHVPDHEAERLLEACLGQLERLCRAAPLAVLLAPPLAEGRAFLIEQVCAQAETLFRLGSPVPVVYQPGLF